MATQLQTPAYVFQMQGYLPCFTCLVTHWITWSPLRVALCLWHLLKLWQSATPAHTQHTATRLPLPACWISMDFHPYPPHLPFQHFSYSQVFTSPLRAAPWPLQGSAPAHAQHTVATSHHSSSGVAATALGRFHGVSSWTPGVLVNAPLLLHLTVHSIHHTHSHSLLDLPIPPTNCLVSVLDTCLNSYDTLPVHI